MRLGVGAGGAFFDWAGATKTIAGFEPLRWSFNSLSCQQKKRSKSF